MKMTKNRENETLSKLNDFKSKLNSHQVKQDEDNWMNNQLRFHVDSQRAFDVNKAQAYQQAQSSGFNFEKFAFGGSEAKKYENAYATVKKPDLGDDVVQGVNLDEIVSMHELIDIARKAKKDQ